MCSRVIASTVLYKATQPQRYPLLHLIPHAHTLYGSLSSISNPVTSTSPLPPYLMPTC